MKGPSVVLTLITLGRPIFVSSWGLGIGSGESGFMILGQGSVLSLLSLLAKIKV